MFLFIRPSKLYTRICILQTNSKEEGRKNRMVPCISLSTWRKIREGEVYLSPWPMLWQGSGAAALYNPWEMIDLRGHQETSFCQEEGSYDDKIPVLPMGRFQAFMDWTVILEMLHVPWSHWLCFLYLRLIKCGIGKSFHSFTIMYTHDLTL